MKLISNRPYLFFWVSIPLILIIGLMSKTNVMDVNIHDTYYVFESTFIANSLSILFLFIGLGYLIIRKHQIAWLTKFHVIITISGTLFTYFSVKLFKNNYYQTLNYLIVIIVLLIIFVQIIFLINFVLGLIKMAKG